jgi:hypothetical protein
MFIMFSLWLRIEKIKIRDRPAEFRNAATALC